ncbi:MAG: site-specific integrase [Desulfovibrio sp.]|uniref:site-specific integrase n=1 Tax=Desulfovibrio sp. TaxID=885 RepID=UPI001A7D4C47|nr:site-specific integrase [Desulfovibrio sp.]MBD5418323.1 site-specific integrase [Desulfovibrio sp.]
MCNDDTLEAQKARLDSLRAQLRQLVDEMLDEPGKRAISIDTARKKLNRYLKRKLDEDATMPMPLPTSTITYLDNQTEHVSIDAIYDRNASEIVKKINTFDDFEDWYPQSVIEMIAEKIFKREEISKENSIQLAKLFQKTLAIYDQIKAARIRGDYYFEQPFYSAVEDLSGLGSDKNKRSQKKIADIEDIKLSKLIQRYCNTQIADGAWKKDSLRDHQGRLENLIEIIGDKEITQINREDMRRFRDILEKLPPSRKKSPKYRDKTINEILAMDYENRLSVKSINIIVQSVSSMFEWAIREGVMQSNPARGLSKRDAEPDIEKREPFTNEEIQQIFYSGDFTPNKFNNPADYWVPLIGLYTGMRLEEICQLHCEDIYKDADGIWLISICEESSDGLKDKRLKTKNAKRQVPIHQELIQLGLIKYMEKIKVNSVRLFPTLSRTENTNKYGKHVGKYFSNLLKKKGIKQGKSFHSLRHTFSNFFKVIHLHNDIFRQVFGHTIPELAGHQYGARFSPKQCYNELIKLLNYKRK